MSNILKELKSEIVRLARKELKSELGPVKKINASQRGLIAGLRKQIAGLQKEVAGLKKIVPASDKAILTKEAPEGRFWISGKGVKNLRKRLGVTQAQLAKLAGVSSQAVVLWEKNKGKINMRKATAGRLQAVRSMGKKEVVGILGKKVKKASTRKAKKA